MTSRKGKNIVAAVPAFSGLNSGGNNHKNNEIPASAGLTIHGEGGI
jgi:hypothetical protein